jgi:hypothetical protein
MSKYIETLIKMLEGNNGILTAKMARNAEIPHEYFSIMFKKGLIEKIGRGLYSSKTTYIDEMFELQATNSNVIFSHL